MTSEEFEHRFPVKLNTQQLQALRSVEGPVLLLAVPGSGKTTVLVARLIYMILVCGIAPEQILTVTYTVAATKDVAARFRELLGKTLAPETEKSTTADENAQAAAAAAVSDIASRMEFRTINGICAKIISAYGRKIGKRPFNLVTDEKSTAGMLSQIYQKTEKDFPAESDLKAVRTLITYIKNMMFTDDGIRALEGAENNGASADSSLRLPQLPEGLHIYSIYKEYCRQLREQNLMDYDDQMIYALNILRSDRALLSSFQKQYSYICVDEAQDTSKIQHTIINLLAKPLDPAEKQKENLFMVGDEDQSIYGFRAAYPEALLHFEKIHPGAGVLLMEQNFRSNAQIVKACDRFIQQNTLRHRKHMTAARPAESEIRTIELKSRNAQYSYLLKVAAGLQEKREKSRSTAEGAAAFIPDTAVLYRDNESAIPLIDQLERRQIPYRIRNAELGFFTHRIVMDIESIIRLAADPYDTEAFLQVYYKLSTYIRKQDALRIADLSRRLNLPVLDTAADAAGLNAHSAANVRSIRTHLRNMLSENGSKAVHRISEYMGYKEYLDRAGMDGRKLEILKSIGAATASPQELVNRLHELQEIIRTKPIDSSCPFILSTIHSSKGLEYDTVYLMDVSDGIFPTSVPKELPYAAVSEAELGAYEEERRLFYVAATRARNNLYLLKCGEETTFLDELLGKPKKKVYKEDDIFRFDTKQKRLDSSDPYRKTSLKKKTSAEDLQTLKSQLGEGIRVRHTRYGAGTVSGVDEANDKVRIYFDFDIEKSFSISKLCENHQLEFI